MQNMRIATTRMPGQGVQVLVEIDADGVETRREVPVPDTITPVEPLPPGNWRQIDGFYELIEEAR